MRHSWMVRFWLGAAAITCAAARADGLHDRTRPIALHGGEAFDTPGEVFTAFRYGIINGSGRVAFVGDSRVWPSGPIYEGAFVWQDGVGERVAREGEPLADHPVLRYHHFGPVRIDDSGGLGFYTQTSSSEYDAVIAGQPGDLRVVALSGEEQDPYGDYLHGIGRIYTPMLAGSGEVGVEAGSGGRVIYTGRAGAMHRRVAGGDPIPGLPEGTRISSVGWTRMDRSGNAVVKGPISGNDFGGAAVLLVGPRGVATVAALGLPAPGTEGMTWGLGLPCINGGGEIALGGSYTLDEGQTLTRAIWRGRPGEMSLAVQQGDPAPGIDGGAFVTFQDPMINRRGGMAFLGIATDGVGEQHRGAWVHNDDGLTLLTEQGDPVGGLGSPATLVSFNPQHTGSVAFAWNSRGQIAFVGTLALAGGVETEGLMATDLDGDLQVLAAVTQPFEVGPGDVRTVREIGVWESYTSPFRGLTGDDGYGTFFNERSELVYTLYFEDGTNGLFISQVPAPPAILVLAAALLGRARR